MGTAQTSLVTGTPLHCLPKVQHEHELSLAGGCCILFKLWLSLWVGTSVNVYTCHMQVSNTTPPPLQSPTETSSLKHKENCLKKIFQFSERLPWLTSRTVCCSFRQRCFFFLNFFNLWIYFCYWNVVNGRGACQLVFVMSHPTPQYKYSIYICRSIEFLSFLQHI